MKVLVTMGLPLMDENMMREAEKFLGDMVPEGKE